MFRLSVISTSSELLGKGGRGRKIAEINIIISSLIVLCGLAYDSVGQFFKTLKMPFFSRDVRCLLYPVCYAYYLIHQSLVLDEHRELIRRQKD